VKLASPDQPAPSQLRYVARQPILAADEKVFGYELLFRDGTLDYFDGADPEAASRNTLSTSLIMGLDVLCDGRRAFINCTRDLLLKDYMTLLPSDQAVLELVQNVPADDLVIAACERMKSAGYMIALDDFVPGDPREKLTPLVDIIKIDVEYFGIEDVAVLVKRYASKNCRMLAKKVETRDQFLAAKKCGFTYFQGYFFRKPELMQAREIPANQVNYLRLLQAISRDELDARELEDILKAEASLCYRLLRYLNSPVFGFIKEIHSVRHALAMLGEREVRRWVRLAATLVAGQRKTSDLVLSALVRARFCELLAPCVPHGDSDLFLVGLLSLMDAILEIPMGLVLEGIAVDTETKAVLLKNESRLSPVFQLMQAQEGGDWSQVSCLSAELGLPPTFVAESHWSAMQWARAMTSVGS
jgi:EAL and modified HD-GYP domain-containing signal transduction protein